MANEHDFLMHYGIKGQKWGVRRFQEENGSYTAAGKERYLGKSTQTNPLGKSQEQVLKKYSRQYFYDDKRASKAVKDMEIERDSDLFVRDRLMGNHRVIKEDLDNHSYLVENRKGAAKTLALIERNGKDVKISAIGEEGLIRTNSAQKYVDSIEKDLHRNITYLNAKGEPWKQQTDPENGKSKESNETDITINNESSMKERAHYKKAVENFRNELIENYKTMSQKDKMKIFDQENEYSDKYVMGQYRIEEESRRKFPDDIKSREAYYKKRIQEEHLDESSAKATGYEEIWPLMTEEFDNRVGNVYESVFRKGGNAQKLMEEKLGIKMTTHINYDGKQDNRFVEPSDADYERLTMIKSSKHGYGNIYFNTLFSDEMTDACLKDFGVNPSDYTEDQKSAFYSTFIYRS